MITSAAGLECTAWDTELEGPNGEPGWTAAGDRVCAQGTAVQVVEGPSGLPAYDAQWGAKLVLDFTAAGETSLDTVGLGITGFAFELEAGPDGTAAPHTLRINLDVVNDPPTTGFAGVATFLEAAFPSEVEFPFSALGRVQDATPADTSEIRALEVHVFAIEGEAKTFSFCLSRLRVLRE